ncbi:DUF7857 domain-containing protein [Natrarchaeobius chitinivorans]|uniref:Uncharacterized protein n=1 Tax=Natrarchaeobius chitinivorans TaxID=1679083 RepID=A0A3N6P7Z2_NATCH|nr:hypothetical protein [Natrarchaeobius chitinivorans]RQG94659.1 hypothetical protein EA473_11300 [Natrarchaeobius chitinivorans]
MVELETETDRHDGVTLVSGVVFNSRTTAQTVRLESRVDGPTWLPRRGWTTVPEWNGDCWEAVVGSNRRRGFGFATPAEPVARPVEIVAVNRSTADERRDPDAVLAELEDHQPTRDVARPPGDR